MHQPTLHATQALAVETQLGDKWCVVLKTTVDVMLPYNPALYVEIGHIMRFK